MMLIVCACFWTAYCPVGWKASPGKNKCFRHVGSSRPWDRSEVFCHDLNGHLAALTSVQEFSFAQSLCADSSRGCWVGGRSYNSSFGFGWKWSDNESRWNESVFPGKPLHINCTSCTSISPTDSCTLVAKDHVALVGERCNTSHELICMIDQGIV